MIIIIYYYSQLHPISSLNVITCHHPTACHDVIICHHFTPLYKICVKNAWFPILKCTRAMHTVPHESRHTAPWYHSCHDVSTRHRLGSSSSANPFFSSFLNILVNKNVKSDRTIREKKVASVFLFSGCGVAVKNV